MKDNTKGFCLLILIVTAIIFASEFEYGELSIVGETCLFIFIPVALFLAVVVACEEKY
jgi:hypothetical protein